MGLQTNQKTNMKKIISYMIVSGESIAELEQAVNNCLETDWQPNGAITIDVSIDKTRYLQPMVQFDDEPELS